MDRDETEIFDLADALERVDGDTELMVEVMQLLRDEIPSMIQSLQAAVASGDSQKTNAAAHFLKGAAANLSANAVVEAARKLEAMANQGDLSTAKTLLLTLETEIKFLDAALEKNIRRLTSS